MPFSLNKIESKITQLGASHLPWYNRFKGTQAYRKRISLRELYIENNHGNLDGIPNASSMRLIDFFRQHGRNNEVSRRIMAVEDNFKVVRKIPIVVTETEKRKYEIMSGYHRAMVYLKKGYHKIPMLLSVRK